MSTIDNKIIPNQLNIIINTSVPGYQKIEYKPDMTIPDISKDERKIFFDPLFKLNKSYVDKVPENLRKKQFFNKSLFDSLQNFTNGTKAESLLQATRNGFVDNNIKVTLDAIFPENSVLYINKSPYVIADVQWSKGDWNIGKKIKKINLDSSKIIDPSLYQTVVKDEIISGETQLNSLPITVIYGSNYTGSKVNTNNSLSSASGVTSVPPSLSSTKNEPISNIDSTSTEVNIKKTDTDKDTPPIQLLTDSFDDESIVAKSINMPNVVEPEKMLISPKTTTILRNFFKDTNFFTLINMLYNASSLDTKKVINNSLSDSLTLTYDSNILNEQLYIKNVSEIKTIQNIGQGNCFFIAVADAINYHNYYNQKNRIISGRYGIGINLYTQLYLRRLVVKYLQSWKELDTYLLNIAPVNADELNKLFEEQINGIQLTLRESGNSDEITPENYIRIANDIFNSRDNFLVKNVENVPINIDEYTTPFKVLEKGQIQRYILSNDFWANEIVIYALCTELKLNIIPLESIKTAKRKTTLRVPYANFSPNINNWNKYLFLFYYQNHYELITFTSKIYFTKTNTTRKLSNSSPITQIKKLKIIFDRNDDITELPPVYILFTIFGSYYSNILNTEDKVNFTFKKEIMLTIQNIINNNLYNKEYYSRIFFPYFKRFFPDGYIKIPKEAGRNINIPIESKKSVRFKLPIEPAESTAIEPFNDHFKSTPTIPYELEPRESGESYGLDYHGGFNPSYNPYYNQPYMAYKMEKKDKDDESQLAYDITIYMELRPGTSLSPEELKNAKCNRKWNSIRKSWADLTGNPYVIPPVYNKMVKGKEEVNKNNLSLHSQNNTRKYIKGGKRNKTVKYITPFTPLKN